jgi:hypothetical protein
MISGDTAYGPGVVAPVLEGRLRLGFSADLQFWHVPLSSGTTDEATIGVTIMPRFRAGRLTAFAGLTASMELEIPGMTISTNDGVESHFVPIVHAGLRVDAIAVSTGSITGRSRRADRGWVPSCRTARRTFPTMSRLDRRRRTFPRRGSHRSR